MRTRTVRRVSPANPPTGKDYQSLQDNVAEAVAQAINFDPAYGVRIDNIALVSTSTTKVAHGLGKMPQSVWIENLARSGTGAVPAVSIEAKDATYVTLYSSAAGSCSLRVY